ncbi:hypothetical protein [Phytoactinopolyspora endophytica]|uniref:hypothetical protein n=1 Tax=Phytoactinopolyspora endophytica TaxID=1642495 RepID=UPI00101D4B66|nr:hypothetical protein [Phytoactinopolyspora endophytica]
MTLAVAALAVAACGGDDGGSGSDGTALRQALARLEATSATSQHISFGDAARIDEASGGTFKGTWGSLTGWGADQLYPYREQLPDVLGIDLVASESLISVGQPPHVVSLIEGGQDADEITAAATASGWSGDPVLTLEMDPSQPVSVSAPNVQPVGSDAVVGGQSADLSVVDSGETSLADAPVIGELADCLGDVVAAQFIQADPYPTGLGVRPDEDDPDTPVSVLCTMTTSVSDGERLAAEMDEAVTSGESALVSRPYADYFTNPDVEILEGEHIVRMEVTHTPDASAITIFQMAATRDLTGLAVEMPSLN